LGNGGNVKRGSGFATSSVLQADGKIVVGGTFDNGSNGFMLARYNANGTLDSTFGTFGVTRTAIGAGDAFSFGIGLLSDGRIVLFCSTSANHDHALTLSC